MCAVTPKISCTTTMPPFGFRSGLARYAPMQWVPAVMMLMRSPMAVLRSRDPASVLPGRGLELLQRHGVVSLHQLLEARIGAQRGVQRIDGEVVAGDRNDRAESFQRLQQRCVLAERGV